MMKYRTTSYRTEIKAVEVSKETDKMIFFPQGGRSLKVTHHEQYHNSLEEARQHLLQKTKRLVEQTRLHLARAESDLAKVEAMQEREESAAAS